MEVSARDPAQMVRVIIQKNTDDGSVEKLVANLGGTSRRDLHIIQAVAAQMPAGAIPALAASPGVRWVSLDAPVISTAVEANGELILRDEFATIAYSGNDGTASWSGDWQEVGESDGPR